VQSAGPVDGQRVASYRAAWQLGALVALISGACSEPRFELDGPPADASCEPDCSASHVTDTGSPQHMREAGSAASELLDAGALADARASAEDPRAEQASAAWKRDLPGTYVLRVRAYGREQTLSNLAVFASEQIWLAELGLDAAGEVAMTTRLCSDFGDVVVPLARSKIEVLEPETQPRRSYRIVYEDGAFRSEGAPVAVGYDEQAPAGCAPGKKIASRPEQSWLRGVPCDCPGSSAPPTLASDCRVTDPDGDGHPGYTIALSGVVQGSDYCRLKDASQFVAGRIARDTRRHTATYLKQQDFYQLACASGNCTRANGALCPGVVNSAEFAPLELAGDAGALSCADVVSQYAAGRFFSGGALTTPAECSR